VPVVLLAALSLSLRAQTNNVLTITPSEHLAIKRGAAADVRLKLELRAGFHVNSDKPTDDYLIPLKLTWAKDPLQAEQVVYPKPQMEKYDFSLTPLSVFSGNFEIVTHFKAPPTATPGPAMINGKLRYQACNNKECLAPKNLDVAIAVDIQ
jgi:thiol:disulfide interchange protein DsbD